MECLQTLHAEISADLKLRAPDFHARIEGENVVITGGHTIRSTAGRELDRFYVQIDVAPGPPGTLPTVYEKAGRLKPAAENHVNADNSCCIGVPAQIIGNLGPRFKLSTFINGPMNDYFLAQAVVAAGGKWPAGTAEHGYAGVLLFWMRKLKVKELEQVLLLLEHAISGATTRKNRKCPCGIRKRTRSCHAKAIKWLLAVYPIPFLESQAAIVRGILAGAKK